MPRKLSKPAAEAIARLSQEVKTELRTNMSVMDGAVESEFSTIVDPAVNRYYELADEMKTQLNQIAEKLDAIEEYCKKIAGWIDDYTSS